MNLFIAQHQIYIKIYVPVTSDVHCHCSSTAVMDLFSYLLLTLRECLSSSLVCSCFMYFSYENNGQYAALKIKYNNILF